MLTMAVGHSDDVDPDAAIMSAIAQCRATLGDRTPQAGLLFCGADVFDPSLIGVVREAFPGVSLVGSTSSAELTSVAGYAEDSISLALFASSTVQFGGGVGSGLADDVDAACRAAVDQALANVTEPPKVCIVLHESLVTDPPLIVEALERAFPPGVAIVGGSSARVDFNQMTPTYQFCNDVIVSDGLAILVLCGQVVHATAVGLGFKVMGVKGTVTRSDRESLQEIDGRSATEFLHRYVDATGPAAYSNPLAVFEADDTFYLRAIQPSEPGSGALATAGSIPVGARVQLTTALTDDVLAGTRDALERARAAFPPNTQPQAAVIFSCAVRKFFLGSRTPIEAELVNEVLGDVPAVGLYCYGEVGPVSDASTRFLNETFVTLLLGT